MSDATIVYTWHGRWDDGAGGYAEFFGGDDGLPCRDLTAADVAEFTEEQNAKLASAAGQRLYRPVKQGTVKRDSKPANAGEV